MKNFYYFFIDEEKTKVDDANESGEESSDESIPDAGALDDEDDSDFDPNDDPEKLWCFCKKPHANRLIINNNFFIHNQPI